MSMCASKSGMSTRNWSITACGSHTSLRSYRIAAERYLDYLRRIGDDLDGFYDPMTKAIWHWAREYPEPGRRF